MHHESARVNTLLARPTIELLSGRPGHYEFQFSGPGDSGFDGQHPVLHLRMNSGGIDRHRKLDRAEEFPVILSLYQ